MRGPRFEFPKKMLGFNCLTRNSFRKKYCTVIAYKNYLRENTFRISLLYIKDIYHNTTVLLFKIN
jgi:hypothetical protein